MSALFDNLPKMPDSVVVLGTGINGFPYHQTLIDEYVIGVNAAIQIMPLKVWLVGDIKATENKWFDTPNNKADLKIFSQRLGRYHIKADYYYKMTPGISDDCEPVLIKRTLRAGATIAGCAIQLAYWCGVKEIILCGVDMTGIFYFDGSKNTNVRVHDNGVWYQKRKLDVLIDAVIANGVDVVSISPTALDIGL